MRPLIPGVLALSLALAGCVGGPEPTASTLPISCDLLSSREVSFLSTTQENNPFMPISGLIRGIDEFVVLRIRLSLIEPSQVAIDGSAMGESGSEVAQLQTLPQMIQYWRDEDEVAQRYIVARSATLTRYYPPSFFFPAKKGRSEYIVVFKGKKPIPRPATILLRVALGDAEPQEFSFPLPDKK